MTHMTYIWQLLADISEIAEINRVAIYIEFNQVTLVPKLDIMCLLNNNQQQQIPF